MLRKQLKIGLVVSEFNSGVTKKLASGARAYLLSVGLPLEQIVEVSVPGGFEIPLAAKVLLEEQGVAGVICLGAVIKGDTDHYTYVCEAVTQGLTDLQLSTGKPVGFGVLMTENMAQALDRAGGAHGNKGEETAHTVLAMLQFLEVYGAKDSSPSLGHLSVLNQNEAEGRCC